METNTTEVTLEHLENDCIIPTFAKENDVCIFHPCFIKSAYEATKDFYHGETICSSEIRASHIVSYFRPNKI
ncbi:DUF3871 family protein [Bacteroides caccae]|uniref:DUF3871 family protein n=1 Tax=Bacteroides caccae TaxID=47678 RepID=UPI003563848E